MKELKFFPYGLCLFLFGCATYEKPPVAVTHNTYSSVQEKDRKVFPDTLKVLSLAEAQRMAIAGNPDFRSMRFSVNAARARYYQSFSNYAPTLNAGMTIQQTFNKIYSGVNVERSRSQSELYRPGLSGSWLIFDSLGREMNVLEKKYSFHHAEALENDAKRLLMKAVAYAYNDVQLARAGKLIALASIEYAEKMLKNAQSKYQAGTVPLSDVLNFEIALRNGKLVLREAEYKIEANKYVLAGYLGLVEGTIPARIEFPAVTFPDVEVLPDISVYLDMALSNRPDLRGFRDSLQAKKYAYYGSLAAFGPTVTTSYALSYGSSRSLSHAEQRTWNRARTGTFSYDLTASWNLFNGFADYFQTKAALAELAYADYQLAENWIGVIIDVRTAYANYKNYVDQAKLSQEIYKLTIRTRDIVESEYNTGTAEVTRLNEAQKALITAQSDLATSVINIANARALLDAAISVPEKSEADEATEISNNRKPILQ